MAELAWLSAIYSRLFASARRQKGKPACLGMVWYGMVEVCEGAPVAVSGWVLAYRESRQYVPADSSGRVYIAEVDLIFCIFVCFLKQL